MPLNYDPGAGSAASKQAFTHAEAKTQLELTTRQRRLTHLYGWYTTNQYDARKVDFDGREYMDPINREAIITASYIPPGFYDVGQQYPIKYRRPLAPYHLARVIVDRFTELLFSENRIPKMRVLGDTNTEDYVAALIEATDFWGRFMLARKLGGAMGSVAIGFQFVHGEPQVEVHDPRWCFPDFEDRVTHKLNLIEKRWIYTKEERVPDGKGGWKWGDVSYWYRRIIDKTRDILFKPAKVEKGAEPIWEIDQAASVEHNLGFCPVVWIQNHEVPDDIDGESDCHGVYDQIEQMDLLTSMAVRGVVLNCLGQETEFITDQGVKSFLDYQHGDSCTVLTHTGQWKPAVVKAYGEQELFAITLQRGSVGTPVTIRATRNHRWLLDDGSRTDHLEVGDRLLSAPSMFSQFEYETATPEERLYWAQGFMWGDGSIIRKKGQPYGSMIRLCGAKSSYASRFREVGWSVTTPPCYHGDCAVYATGFMKSLPNPETTPLALLRAFVRGYIDADGTKQKEKKASTRWRRIQATGDASIDFIRTVFPAVGLYIGGEVDMTGQATGFGGIRPKTIRFSLNENTSHYVNSLWRVVAIEPLHQTEIVWCLEVEEDQSLCLNYGISLGNCDPTVVVTTDVTLAEIAKGSDNTVKLQKGDDFKYVEINGAGPKAARELAAEIRVAILEVTQTHLQGEASVAKTATEIEREFASMLAKASMLRRQYGKGCLALMKMMLRAAQRLQQGRTDESGQVVKGYLKLPPRIEEKEDGQVVITQRKLGGGGHLKLVWPKYFEYSLDDVAKATTAAGEAKEKGLIDAKHASGFVADMYHIESVTVMLDEMKKEEKAAAEEAQAAMMPPPGDEGMPPGF